MRNEVGKLTFLLAIQQYFRQNEAQEVCWVRSHSERRKLNKMEYDLDEWGIYLADCYASNKKPPSYLVGYSHTITVEQVIRNVFPRQSWYLSNNNSIPIMVDLKRRYQDQLMMEYWQQRDGQAGHEEVYKGSSTYMMQQVGNLRYCNMRQRARKVKLMLDWGAHGRRMRTYRL